MFSNAMSYIDIANDILVSLLILGIGVAIVMVGVLYVIDITQTQHAIRRNFPVVGRFRYFFEHLGEFFSQYFFTSFFICP